MKKKKSVIRIFFEGLKIYCLNLHKFLLYMLFPVLGQLIGTVLILAPLYWLLQNIESLKDKFNLLNDLSTLFFTIILISIPGLIIVIKAFWEYLVAFVSLNSMTEGYLNTGKVYDFKSHKDVVYNKTFSFMALWLLYSIFMLISIIPVFWIIGFIFFIYFILIFQVLTFENGLSPIGYFKRSFEIIRGNFWRTLLLAFLLLTVTYYLLPSGFTVLSEASGVTNLFSKLLENWTLTLPLEPIEAINFIPTPELISKAIFEQTITFAVIGLTLPLRSICWTLWYNNLSDNQNAQETSDKKKKKTSKKKREIDPEIIERAMAEDDEY